MKAKTISAAQLRKKFFVVLDELGPGGIIITKHGRAVAKLMPIEPDSAELIGSLKNELEIHENVLSTGIEWHNRS